MPAWAWWGERLTIGLVIAELAAVAAGAARVPGAHAALSVVGVAGAVTGLAVVIRISPIRRRLLPDRSWKLSPDTRSLQRRLLDGGPIAPAERAVAGRLAWWKLVTDTVAAWVATMGTGSLAANLFDTRGRFHWGWGWPAVSLLLLVFVLATLTSEARMSARWRRIAHDPALVEPPATA